MQPLYSVDHETRQNSSRVEEGVQQDATEEMPLLHRFPPPPAERSPFMMVAVSLLLTILVTGVIIGIYLLVLQSNSENLLPPVDTPLQLVSRKQWRSLASPAPVQTLETSLNKAKQVIVVQTDTRPCITTYSCAVLLQSFQNTSSPEPVLPYNFLVSTNGETYEALGWHQPTPLFPMYPGSLLLAFIGNFTEKPPSKMQIDETKNFIAESVSLQHLDPNYVVFGKTMKYKPTYLFSSLANLPQWSTKLSDG